MKSERWCGMNDLEIAIADTVEGFDPGLADLIRKAKRAGIEKSAVIKRVTLGASEPTDNPLVRSAILILVDKIWREPSA